MPLVELKRDVSRREVRQFAFGWLPGACLVAAMVALMRYDAAWAAVGLVALAVASVALGAIASRAMRAVLLGWLWVTYPLAWLVSAVLLAAVYFLVITPIAVARRLVRRDPLKLRIDRDAESYWTSRSDEPDRTRYFRQF